MSPALASTLAICVGQVTPPWCTCIGLMLNPSGGWACAMFQPNFGAAS
jgi:hypothetical protein